MIILWFIILGGVLLLAFILGGIGFLSTKSRRDLIPGLFFGLPAVILSLPIFIFCVRSIESGIYLLFLFGIVAIPPLYLGSLVLCRGLQTGTKAKDAISGTLVCVTIFVCGFLLSEHHDITDMIFVHLLPMSPIL
jgi:hypothetical protein